MKKGKKPLRGVKKPLLERMADDLIKKKDKIDYLKTKALKKDILKLF